MTLLVGSLTRKIVSEMTYNVSSGTLNASIPIPSQISYFISHKQKHADKNNDVHAGVRFLAQKVTSETEIRDAYVTVLIQQNVRRLSTSDHHQRLLVHRCM